MTKHMRFLNSLCLVLLLVLVAVASATADCPAGTGGTGLHDARGTGGGGTGVHSGETGSGGTGHGGDTGSGGTGLVDAAISGSGGTGVLGTITGFGSVCVNGLRVTYGDEVAVEVDGLPAGVADLAIGHVVRIRAVRGQGALRATHIAAEAAIAGPIESFDAAGGHLVVMGQSVEVGSSTVRLTPLAVGDRVSVSGLRRPDGVVSASRIAARSPQALDLVTGRPMRATPQAAYVGDVRADLGSASARGASDRVQFEGTWDPERRSLVVAATRPAPVVSAREDRLSLEGYVASEGGELRVNGIALDLRAGEREGEAGAPPRVGTRVRVEGPYRDGRLAVDRLRFERDSAPSDRGERAEGSDRADRADRSGRSDRADRPERGDRGERPERSERSERPERANRSGHD